MLSTRSFRKMKKKDQKIVMITAYDYPSGKYAQAAGVDMILVGDSLGMVVLGYPNTLRVTMEDIIHHSKATRRGASETFIVADMPFMSYHISLEQTKRNAARLILEADANAVKLEGGSASRLDAIRAITDCEIPVVAHLGLTPQSINTFGGYVVQGKKEADSQKIMQQAKAIQEAGAFMLVLEGIPEKLGQQITTALKIPTIGIGAGRYCDGQVLVYHDILGMSDFTPKFVKQYANLETEIPKKLAKYVAEVRKIEFPGSEHIYFPI
ncbi:MAG: 3-methyl-2-oxobutanoate hydroxymethyltransferase [Candidatus Cloacimonadota bacterium]|nr:3-methyl-2-oxobutanoate hydroxymethyltransferase [Candidatus Cloacimonadota bacterium]